MVGLIPEIDRLEAMFSSIVDDERETVAARLQAFVSRLSDAPPPEDDVAEKLHAASIDEVFEFIDQELGQR